MWDGRVKVQAQRGKENPHGPDELPATCGTTEATSGPKGVVLKRLALSLVVVSGAFAAMGAPVASAHSTPHPHEHFIVTPNGDRHNVGPACGNDEAAHRGWHNFHNNVHVGKPAEADVGGSGGAFQNPNNPVALAGGPCT